MYEFDVTLQEKDYRSQIIEPTVARNNILQQPLSSCHYRLLAGIIIRVAVRQFVWQY